MKTSDYTYKTSFFADKRAYSRQNLRDAAQYVITFLKWTVIATIVGIICGSVGVAFHYCVDIATEWRMEFPFLIYLLPLAGAAIVFLYHKAGRAKDAGTNMIIDSIRTQEKPPFCTAPLIFVSTALTHLFGGSSGREGAALQIGGSLGASIGRLLKLGSKDMTLIVMCGMSAVFSALFGTPLTACIFSLEVISVGSIYYSALIPCLFSSLAAFEIAQLCKVPPTAFVIQNIPEFQLQTGIQVVALAALCAVTAIVFCVSMHTAGHIYQKRLPNPYIRAAVGGVLVILLTLLVGTRDYNGAGMQVITSAMDGTAKWEAFLLKILFTALTLGAGYKGGEIVPTFFIGSTFGCTAGALLGLDPGFAASVGLIATFCGVVNCPIASICLSIELFGANGLLYYALACAVTNLLSGRYSLYSSQRIVYSKLEPTYINERTR